MAQSGEEHRDEVQSSKVQSIEVQSIEVQSSEVQSSEVQSIEVRANKIDVAYQLSPKDESAKEGMHPGGIVLMTLGLLVAVGICAWGMVTFWPAVVNQLPDWAARIGLQFPNSTGLGTGDVQVTLRWRGEADLDLRVVDPTGGEVSYETPRSASGGILDADANGACEGAKSPVENIYWSKGVAPKGAYEVVVVYYHPCRQDAVAMNYEVTILVDGDVVDVVNGEANVIGERISVATFEY